MSAQTTSPQSLANSISSVINRCQKPAAEEGTKDVIVTSGILTISLVIVVPLLSLGNNIALLGLVPIVALSYGIFIYKTNRLFSGTVSGFFVLTIFDANIPLISGPTKGTIDIYLVDPLLLFLLVILIYDFARDAWGSLNSQLGWAAVGGFAMFTIWSALSAIIGNGPSQLAAIAFAAEQVRYFLIFLVSILIVSRTNVWFGIYPLMISIGGNLLYAVAEALSGHSFGLTFLGDSDGKFLSELTVGSITFITGYYPGGFVGISRSLIGLLLLLLPFLIFWERYKKPSITIVSILGILGISLIIKFAETDAGWMASLLMFFVLGGLYYLHTNFSNKSGFRGVLLSIYGISLGIILYFSRFVGSNSQSVRGSGGGAGSGGATSSSTQTIAKILAIVPGVKVDTLGVRLTQYSASIDVIQKHPYFGIGGYNFIQISHTYGLPSEQGIHNTFFSHLAATGIPGALAYTTSVVSIAVLAALQMLRKEGEARLLWGSVLTSFIGFHSYSFWVVAYGWPTMNAGFWALSGSTIGALALIRSDSSNS
jgi:hypothetical protein